VLTTTPVPVRTKFALVVAVALLVALASGTPPARASADQIAGVQAHLLWGSVDSTERARQLDAAQDLGAGMVRVDVGWSSLEQNGKGQYAGWYLNKIDSVVNEAEARGLKLLFTFTETPCWASSAPDSLKQDCVGSWWDRGVEDYAPQNPADYADALAFLVRRYRGRVAAWEIWNEPNLDSFFKAPDKASAYVALAKAAYPAAKAADPGTTVLAGALADAHIAFARALYAAGLKGSFDAFSVHPYSGDRSPLDPLAGQDPSWTFIRGVPGIHQVMLDNSDNKPLWLTEFGWNTSTERGTQPWRNGVSEGTQATYIEQAYRQMAEWSYVPVGITYGLKDRSSDISYYLDNFGLLRYDGSRKPAYAAYQRGVAALAQGTTTDPGSTDSGTGTTEPPDTGTTEPPSNGSSKPPGKGKKPRLRLRALQGDSVLHVRGRTLSADVVKVKVKSMYGGKPAYTATIPVPDEGSFSERLTSPVLHGGPWRATAVLVENGARDSLRAG
jgi:polysaccharide biosynthesis protein PslG